MSSLFTCSLLAHQPSCCTHELGTSISIMMGMSVPPLMRISSAADTGMPEHTALVDRHSLSYESS